MMQMYAKEISESLPVQPYNNISNTARKAHGALKQGSCGAKTE